MTPTSQAKVLASFATPQKYYPLGVDSKRSTITVFLSPSAKKTEDAIYKFKRKSDNACYVGMTAHVGKRIHSHHYSFRHATKEAGQSSLAKAVRKNPEDFEFGIIITKEKVEGSSLDELEGLYIEFNKKKGKVFNKRRGGGGGVKRATKASRKSQKKVSEKVQAIYRSPDKSYPLDKKTYKVLLTPNAKGDLYILKRVQKVDGKDVIKRYIGKTERTAKKRLGEHSHYARRSDKPRGQKELYKDMRKFPGEFEVKLLSSEQFGNEDLDLLERGVIEFYEERGVSLYNQNKGGGGGHARKSLRF